MFSHEGKKQEKLKPLQQNISRLIFTKLALNSWFFTKFIFQTKIAKLSNLGFATF